MAENKFFQENAFIALEQNNSMSFLRQRIMFKTIWYKPRRYSLSFYIDILFSEYKKMVYTDMHIGIINILFGKINITTSCFIRFKTKMSFIDWFVMIFLILGIIIGLLS